MSSTIIGVQATIASAERYLAKTTVSYPQMVTKYGTDWKKWPTTSNWHRALAALEQAKVDVGHFTSLAASFSHSEV